MRDYLAQCGRHMRLAHGDVAAELAEGIKEGAFLVQVIVPSESLSQGRFTVHALQAYPRCDGIGL